MYVHDKYSIKSSYYKYLCNLVATFSYIGYSLHSTKT